MKYLNIVFCMLMILFAAVQYNDPDTMFWIVIYLIPALWTGLAAFRPKLFRTTLPMTLLGACVVVALIGSIYFWPGEPGFWRKDVWWESETAREGMGMMIATVALIVASVTVWLARATGRGQQDVADQR